MQGRAGLGLAGQGQGQGRARPHLAGGGELQLEPLLQLLLHLAVERRLQGAGRGLQGCGAARLLQLLHQQPQVVGLGARRQGVSAGVALAHPQMGPAQGQLGDAAPLDGARHLQQGGQPGFGAAALQACAAVAAQLAGAAGPGKAFAQLPGLAAGFKAQLHLGQAAVGQRAQFLDAAAGGCGLEEQGLVQRFDDGALAGFVGPADQRQARGKAELQLKVLPHPLEPGGDQAHASATLRCSSSRAWARVPPLSPWSVASCCCRLRATAATRGASV